MTNTIQDIENPNAVISFFNGNPDNQNNPNITDSLFDNTYNNNDMVTAIFGQDQTLNGLREEDNDAKVTFLNNNGFKTKPFNLLFFKNAKLLNETRRNQIQQALYNNNNTGLVEAISRTQMNDAASLLANAKLNREKLGMEAITTGKIESKSGTIDFEMPENHKVTVDTAWGNKDATPLKDLKEYASFIRRDNNTIVTIAMMNSNTFYELSKSGDVIQSMGIGRLSDNFVAPDQQVKDQVKASTNLQILIYDKKDFLPDNKVVLIPSGSLGRMAWNDTPEALGLSQEDGSQLATTTDGITMLTYRQMDPVGTIVKASQKFLPVLDKSQNIMIINTNPQDSRLGDEPDNNSDDLSQVKKDLTAAKRNLTNAQKGGNQEKINEAQSEVDTLQAKVDELSK